MGDGDESGGGRAFEGGSPEVTHLSLFRAFSNVYQEHGVVEASKELALKVAHVAVPVAELVGVGIAIFVLVAVARSHNAKKHTVLIDGRVSPDREPPRDIMKKQFFQNKQGLWLHHHLWWNEKVHGPAKGVAVILHGHSEHSRRFEHFAEMLNKKGIAVFGLDHQGFGRSEGDRGHVEDFNHYSDDVVDYMVKVMWNEYPEWHDLPRFVAGHSMGGLISIHVGLKCQQSDHPAHKLTGMMLSAPALHLDPGKSNILLQTVAGVLDFIAPKAPIVSFPSRPSTSFLQVKLHATFDPLNYHGNIRVHQGLELVKGTKEAIEHAGAFAVPLLIVHGDRDMTVHITGSHDFIKAISSEDKTLIELEGLLHEPWQEEQEIREPILEAVVAWAEDRLATTTSRQVKHEKFTKAVEGLSTADVPFKMTSSIKTCESAGADFVRL